MTTQSPGFKRDFLINYRGETVRYGNTCYRLFGLTCVPSLASNPWVVKATAFITAQDLLRALI